MSQHDFEIANQGFPSFRSDLNSGLQALASNSAGATEPSTTYAYQFWYDSTANILKMRNADDDAWITLAYFDQTNDEWEVRSAVIQAVDSAGVVIKTDDGTTRLTIADDGSITTQGDLTVGGDLDVSSGTIKLDGNYPVGTKNVALGDNALSSNSTGDRNVAIGDNALLDNVAGQYNVAVGQAALENNTASSNTAVGRLALYANTTADDNTAVGRSALEDNTTGTRNAAFGTLSLTGNTTGDYNTALGYQALESNTTANGNAAFGYTAGQNNTGTFNTYLGYGSGYLVTSGSKNTILGGYTGNQGGLDIRTSSNNIVLSDGDGNPRQTINSSGYVNWGTDPDYNDAFLNLTWSAPAKIGFTYNNTVSGGGAVNRFKYNGTTVGEITINNTSTTYTTSSDYRLKENVVDLTGAIDRLKQLPVHTFNFISDPDTTVDGFLAHEAQAVVPEAVTGTKDEVDENGDPKYQGIDQSKLVPLLTAALKEAITEIESLKERVATLESN